MNLKTAYKSWNKEFVNVDQWGRSYFRLLLVGAGIIWVVWMSERYSGALNILGLIFIIYSLLIPTVIIIYRIIKNAAGKN